MKHSRLTLTAIIIATAISTSGCIIHVGAHENDNNQHRANKHQSHDTVFGGIDIKEHQHVKNLSSVNGGIDLANGVTAKNVETVNGGIDIGRNVTIKSASTVNGGIDAKSNLNVEKDLSTVNGGIRLSENSSVGKDVSTVNGEITLIGTTVGAQVKTVNGDIKILNNSVVEGDIVYENNNKDSWWKNSEDSLPTLRIDNSSQVLGRIILERRVILEVEDDALLEKVERRYSQ
ncbi:hypothetical protein L0668_17785 [Paraglaciecola aquimarina]|uniref:Adhesin domain-containing protein n=1 Tax=Paraglaciecola algarum TaxID=3050085 RepID=A0ABS9DDZ1_9ALTE|nr:hypothetical protein [Paraglaciecola sp. G1-23]MCF2949974.1 hypothetical protein [Paraglaciecola sp. G1-23]